MAKLDGLRNTKTRALALLGIFLLVIIIIAIILLARKPNPLKTEESHPAKIPQITAIPGNVTSEKYQELQEEDNRRRAEQAKKTGGSAVATIIGSRDKDALSKKESFGIEGEFLKAGDCRCPPREGRVPTLDPATAAKLISEIEANPSNALKLMQQNPGLAKALCTQKPDLALKVIENNKEAARLMLKECPAMAKMLAAKNPALLKQLLLEDPELAKKIAESNPEVLKDLMEKDPEFARQFAKANPDVVKTLMKNDPDFADKMAKANPDMVKELMKNDPEFARILAKNNPALVKKLMLDDPEFAKLMAQQNPDMVKDLMKSDPDFARALAEKNPTLVKELMKNDPAFANLMAQQNPDMVKKLMLDDPEFAKIMAHNNPDMVKTLMENDPNFSKALLAKNPSIQTILDASEKKFPFISDKQRLQALEEARRRQKDEQTKKLRDLQLSDQQQKQIAALMSGMEAQSKAAFQAWNEISLQQFVQGGQKSGDKGDGSKSDGSGTAGGGQPSSASGGEVLLKAGTLIFSTLDTSINSDEPGPIMGTIIQGPFQGAKVLGEVQLANQPGGAGNRPEKVILSFSTLTMPNFPKSIPIKAVAVDPDTARTALGSDVDHHYLLRYGSLFASSFMAGYAKVIAAQGTVQTTNMATGSTTTTTPSLNGRQQIFAALGEVGKKFGDVAGTYFNIPNTITVQAGTGFALLILSDVTNAN